MSDVAGVIWRYILMQRLASGYIEALKETNGPEATKCSDRNGSDGPQAPAPSTAPESG